MKTEIHWASDDTHTTTNQNPWQPSKTEAFRDLILQEDLRARRLRFEAGQTWLRIVPAFAGSPYTWMMGVHALSVPGALFAHPKTLKRNARSLFDHAYEHLKAAEPSVLFSKTNKNGIRLLSDPISLFWCLVEQNGRYVARLVQASGYDGSRGGAPGLGNEILRLTQRRDETGMLMAEPVHRERGVLIGVTKSKAHGAKYPTYNLTVGRQPAPMHAILDKVDPTELEVMRPLEQVVHQIRDEEEWELLARVLKPHHIDALRASLSR